MGYPFGYAPGLCSTSFSMYCTAQGAHRNGASVYIWDVGWWTIVQVEMLHQFVVMVSCQWSSKL